VGYLVGYLYGQFSLFYVIINHLLVYIREDISCIHYHHFTPSCTCLRYIHEEILGKDEERKRCLVCSCRD
jgi:hypothetical protein